MSPVNDRLKELLRILEDTAPSEIDCEEFLSRVGSYVESLTPGAIPPTDFDAVVQHLRVCTECKEELEGLMKAFGDADKETTED